MELSREAAETADADDPLAGFRSRFAGAGDDGPGGDGPGGDGPGEDGPGEDGPGHDSPDRLLYLDGNSLGRMPLATPAAVTRVVEREWAQGLVGSWSSWIGMSTRLGDALAAGVLGARAGEVLVADSVTVNLYKLLVAALGARPGRDVLVCSADDFPTDRWVLAEIARARGLTVREVPADIDTGLDPAALAAALDDRVAVVLLSQVAYRSGALADLAAVTEQVHAAGALVLWDLSHSVGSVPADLTAAGADLAVGCTYKYLNGGPGSPAFLYVRRDLQDTLRSPIAGWFGARDQFGMGPRYEPADGVERFGAGTPPVLGMAAMEVGAGIVAEAGIDRLAAKARAMTALLVDLTDEWLAPHGVALASPRDPAARGAHVTLHHPRAWQLTQALIDRRVVPDFRTPDRVRLGPAPLYTRFVDVWDAMDRFRDVLATGAHERFPEQRARVT